MLAAAAGRASGPEGHSAQDHRLSWLVCIVSQVILRLHAMKQIRHNPE